MLVCNTPLLINRDMSQSIISDKFYLNQVYGFSIQAVFTGSPIGALKLQGSNDPGNKNGGLPPKNWDGVINWTDITGSSQTVNASGTGDWNFNGSFYLWVRVVWTPTSDSGNLNLTLTSKGI